MVFRTRHLVMAKPREDSSNKSSNRTDWQEGSVAENAQMEDLLLPGQWLSFPRQKEIYQC